MEFSLLKYKFTFCVLLAIIFPLQIDGQLCKLSNEDEIRIKLSEVERKLQTFEKYVRDMENNTLHYQHNVKEVTEDLKKLSSQAQPLIRYFGDCYKSEPNQYRGKRTFTKSGRTCQSWSSQYPHSHDYKLSSSFPDSTVHAAANYCRAPGGGKRLWCFTTDPSKRWESCNIPKCG